MCCRSATRTEREDAEEEMVVAALLHDIGDVLALESHSQFAASLLQSYVCQESRWIIRHHGKKNSRRRLSASGVADVTSGPI
jgi:predicted HD phosphohydrolase